MNLNFLEQLVTNMFMAGKPYFPYLTDKGYTLKLHLNQHKNVYIMALSDC